MSRGCNCVTLAGPAASYWTNYEPNEIVQIIEKYRGDFWWAPAIPILRESDVTNMIGKWVYYFQRGNFPNTEPGRQAASAVIAKDIAAETGILYPSDKVYTVLQNANAYLLKELKVAPEARGPESPAVRIEKKIKASGAEVLNRAHDAVHAITDPITGLFKSPWSWGAAALVAGAFVAVKVLPQRKSR